MISAMDPTVLQITNKGFQFLLQDVNTQVWAFLLQYLNMAEVLLGYGCNQHGRSDNGDRCCKWILLKS